MNHIRTIFWKQIKDTLKNKTVLVQFIMLPVLTIIMNNTIHIKDMPRNYFITLFSCMYIGMAPLTSMASVISEEKEKNTLRVLMMSNVKPLEYITGIGGYLWIICMMGAAVFCITGQYSEKEAVIFLIIMGIGILTSLIIGAAIGAWSKNQMTATSVTVPIMMIFSFLPMLSMFNDTIAKIARVTYSGQISILMNNIANASIKSESIIIISINILLALSAFIYTYKKCGLS